MSPTEGVAPAAEPVPPAAALRGVRRVYRAVGGDTVALDGVDLVVATGALTVVAGPSGSGKSTLLHLLALLDSPDEGAVEVGGRDVSRLGRRSRRLLRRGRLGFVAARPSANLLGYLTVDEHLRLAADLRGVPLSGTDLARLDALDLGHRRGHRPDQLSGGEQQRLAFAAAVVGGPDLVVADEPTAELDPSGSTTLVLALRRLVGDGAAIVVASHDPAVVGAADHMAWMDDGRIVTVEGGGEGDS